LNELEAELFTSVRKTVGNLRSGHPWVSMDNVELLKSAGMYLKDQSTGEQGITLAGILIFGSELMIQTALPHYRTDAILRRNNLDRYDDRDDIRVNLLRSYERFMQFIAKHLNDKFFLEGDVFKTIIPLTVQDTNQDNEDIRDLLEFCRIPRTRGEMQQFMVLSNQKYYSNR